MIVEVYWNLHKHCWSVRNKKTGLVEMHLPHVCIRNAQFIVRPAGRLKVVLSKQKNVHAFVRGELDLETVGFRLVKNAISYNPYRDTAFMAQNTLLGRLPVRSAEIVMLESKVHESRNHPFVMAFNTDFEADLIRSRNEKMWGKAA